MNLLLHILHCFPKYGIVHEVVKVLLKIVFGLFLKFCVHSVVWLHPALLVNLQHPVNLLEFHPLIEIKLQISVMHEIVLFVLQHQDKLCFVVFQPQLIHHVFW